MHMTLRAAALAVATAFVAIPGTHAAAAVVSSFDTDSDGWITFQNTGAAIVHSTSGGNPGGHISVTDVTQDWGYVQAPDKFLAPASYGGTLSFDMRTLNSQPTQFPGIYGVRVGLQGAGFTLISETSVPTASWTSYSFGLTELTGWRIFSNLNQNYSGAGTLPTEAQMRDILANLTRLVIATDYTNACTLCNTTALDITYLDNVRIDQVTTPVPVPAALPLLGSAIVLLAGLSLRRSRRTA